MSSAEHRRTKTQARRRGRDAEAVGLGAVYTPALIAEAIIRYLKEMPGFEPDSILEPSVGDGAFVQALLEVDIPLKLLTAVDVNAAAVAPLAIRHPDAQFLVTDFLDFAAANSERSFDLIVGNPPFVRSRNLPPEAPAKMDALSERTGYPRSRVKNAWSAFVLAAEAMVSQRGSLAFVLPYEILHVDYGTALLDWLAQRFERLDIFISDERAFKGIDQDAIVLTAARASDDPGVFVRRVCNLENLLDSTASIRKIEGSWRGRLLPKSFLIDTQSIEIVSRIRLGASRFDELCANVAGIVTAANDFFILDEDSIDRNGLRPWAKPILKRGSLLSGGCVFSEADYNRLLENHPGYVLDFSGLDRSEAPSSVKDYLAQGERQGVDKTYKALARRCWYELSIPETASGFFFKRSHSYPRICVNEANVHVTDAAYLLRPFPGISMKGLCFSFYNSLTLLFAELHGRFYGGGVLEITPNELRRLPIMYTEPTESEFAEFASASHWSDPVALVRAGDAVLERVHGISADDLDVLRTAWESARGHRLRHG